MITSKVDSSTCCLSGHVHLVISSIVEWMKERNPATSFVMMPTLLFFVL